MLKTILSISGKPGLYKLISQGRNMLIVESLTDKKRFPAYGNEKIISLGDIAMYTDTDDVPLKDVLTAMKEKENGAAVVMDLKKATADELRAYLGEVLPTFDRDRVYLADIKKLISWYNLLVACGITDFEDTAEAETTAVADTAAEIIIITRRPVWAALHHPLRLRLSQVFLKVSKPLTTTTFHSKERRRALWKREEAA